MAWSGLEASYIRLVRCLYDGNNTAVMLNLSFEVFDIYTEIIFQQQTMDSWYKLIN
jgi:hypothetical protein